MADNLKERTAEMKALAEKDSPSAFLAKHFPVDVLALIAEIERLQTHVADLNHDLDAAIKECNEQHG